MNFRRILPQPIPIKSVGITKLYMKVIAISLGVHNQLEGKVRTMFEKTNNT
jgi:hypothetical protein